MRALPAMAIAGLVGALALGSPPASAGKAPAGTAEPPAGGTKAAAGAGSEAAEAPPLAVTDVEVRPRVGWRMQRLDLAIRLSGGPFANPDDPDEIDVRAVFETPGGETVTVPAFWYQAFRADDRAKRLVPEGEPGFRVRYMPREPGAYTCTVRARAGERDAAAEPLAFRVLDAEPKGRGFLRFHAEHPTYYQDPRTGETVFLMGCHLDVHQFGDKVVEKTYGTRGLCDPEKGITPEGLYATYAWCRTTVEQLADAGATCIRLPLHSWFVPLEAQGEKTWIPGLEVGRYVAGNAWIADQVVRLAERRGLAVIPVTWNGRPVALKKGEQPYAILSKNEAPARRRLRYQVARWSYSPAVLGWTLFDHGGFRPTGSRYWRDLIAYLRGLDPNEHFVFNTPYGVDQSEQVSRQPYAYPLAYFHEGDDRPQVVTAYGMPKRVAPLARAGLWASLAGHRAGALFAHAWHLREAEAVGEVYRPVAAMLKAADLGSPEWRPARTEPITGPRLHAWGMVGDRRRAFLYLMRTSVHVEESYSPANGAVLSVGDFEPGQYVLQWWGPGKEEPTAGARVRCGDNTILVTVPDGVAWHIMAKIVPVDEAAEP